MERGPKWRVKYPYPTKRLCGAVCASQVSGFDFNFHIHIQKSFNEQITTILQF